MALTLLKVHLTNDRAGWQNSAETDERASTLLLSLLSLILVWQMRADKKDANGPEYPNSLGMKMIRIPAGHFPMGDDLSTPAKLGQPALFTKGDYDEKPVHDIKLTYDFYISEAEITAQQFAAFRMDYQDAGRFAPYATGMSWDDAAAFCRWLSQKRKTELPSADRGRVGIRCASGINYPFYRRQRRTTCFRHPERLGCQKHEYGCDGVGIRLVRSLPGCSADGSRRTCDRLRTSRARRRHYGGRLARSEWVRTLLSPHIKSGKRRARATRRPSNRIPNRGSSPPVDSAGTRHSCISHQICEEHARGPKNGSES